MPRRKHNPERTCLGCFSRDAKSAMLRVVVREEVLALDPTGCASGRGGYLHPQAGCVEKFVRSKVKEYRSLKTGVSRCERLRLAEEVSRRLDSGAKVE